MQQLTHPLNGIESVLIYGYGIEGQSTEVYFERHYPDVRTTIYAEDNPKYQQKRDPNRYDLTVVTPGVDRRVLAEYTKARLSSNTELFFDLLSEQSRSKVLAITGTKGKSTTTKYLYELLLWLGYKAEVAGNYGKGMLEVLDSIEDLDFVVLELSSFQLENLTKSPHYAGFVNLYEDHLDRHGDMKAYFEAKSNIFRHQQEGDLLFVPDTYEKFLEPARSIFSSMAEDEEGRMVETGSVPEDYFGPESMLRAAHIRSNLGIAAEMVRRLVSNDPELEQKIKAFSLQFVPLEHRLELVTEIEGKRFVNDSQSTNQYSAIAGMEAFGDKLGTLIVGGKDKGNRYELLIDQILKQHPYVVILDTEVGQKLSTLLEGQSYDHYAVVQNFADAVELGFQFTEPGKVCLMSPAAASFDWFKNYKDRGDQFKTLVLAKKS
jgi:UDP-N-acetylmuramoyl-L-alanine---L-glutamate ligase